VQLRQDNLGESLTWLASTALQSKRLIIPGLEHAEFERLGQMHRILSGFPWLPSPTLTMRCLDLFRWPILEKVILK
jgi:folate-dependent tRNA-U54 methylase TrmFO/GidA